MLGVWPASYVNYVPTNDLILAPAFWKPGRSLESKRRDREARDVLRQLFPGREIVPVHPENVVRGGGGMNCITQQQPASARFAERCGWAKVQVATGVANLYAGPIGWGRCWAASPASPRPGATSTSSGSFRSEAGCSSG